MNWFDSCDWTEQDATRTLEHLDGLLTLWTAGIEDASPDISAATERVSDIGRTWRDRADRPALAAELFAHLTSIESARADRVASHIGAVQQINSSRGGVPKSAINSATVGWRGVEGDVQQTRVHHGRPWQALCLWSADVIDHLQAEGHPVTAGGVGENLTLRNIDWGALRAGAVLQIGDMRCQLTSPAVPCSKVASNFTNRDLSLIDHDHHPGQTRWYAAVLQPGTVDAGDTVTVSPSD